MSNLIVELRIVVVMIFRRIIKEKVAADVKKVSFCQRFNFRAEIVVKVVKIGNSVYGVVGVEEVFQRFNRNVFDVFHDVWVLIVN